MRQLQSFIACAVTASCFATTAWSQCDVTTPGNFSDTTFNNSASVDPNGGWNVVPASFIEMGSVAIGSTVRVKGVVGSYIPTGGTTATSRDLDWMRFSVSAPCYITVTLSMADASGNPLNGTAGYDYLAVYQGSVQATSKSLYSGYGRDADGLGVCPHSGVYTFANGVQQARFPVPAGEILIIASAPFNPTGSTIYNGPMAYAVNVAASSFDNASCSSASNDCITASASGGCSDGACCDLVCGFTPDCCDVRWDSNCVSEGVTQCGNFIYACTNPGPSNDCVSNAQTVDIRGGIINVSFDNSAANTDGPNDVTRLCSSSMARDVWFLVGPMPTDGDLTATMCGRSNVGDSVLNLFNLGLSNQVGNPGDLPSKYVACRDDTCDDNGDGTTDAGGPPAIQLIGTKEGEYYLVRVGSFMATGETPADTVTLVGEMQLSFRAKLYDNGRQKKVKKTADGSLTNLYFTTGYVAASGSTAAKGAFSLATPFTIGAQCKMDGFEFCGLLATGQSCDTMHWYIYNRGPLWQTSWGVTSTETLVAEGTVPFDPSVYSNINTDYGRRYFIDLPEGAGVDLAPADYYFVVKGEQSGSAFGAMGQFYYAADAIPQQSPTSFRPAYWANSNLLLAASAWSRFAAVASPTYVVQDGDNVDKFYKPAVKLKGQFGAACFGDLDGSGEVDAGDVGLVLLDTGACAGCPTDLDGSGEVDSGDVGLVLLSAGPCQ